MGYKLIASLATPICVCALYMLYSRRNNYIYRHFKSNIVTADHYDYISNDINNYKRLTREGKDRYLSTFFVSEDINMTYAKISNRLYKMGIELERENPYRENIQYIAAKEFIKSNGIKVDDDITDNIDYNTYIIVGKDNFFIKPDKEHNCPITLPIVNKNSLAHVMKIE